jgi:hypothetical protein
MRFAGPSSFHAKSTISRMLSAMRKMGHDLARGLWDEDTK